MGKGEQKTEGRGLVSQVTQLAGLVNYQTDAIVSRMIIDKPTGSVTMFAFDEGQGLSEHTVPYDALVYLIEGEADITISGKPYHLNVGEMIIMPAGKPHSVKAVKRFKMMLTMILSPEE
jgi:quercetin dioxygenase-like cupin family protein